MIAWERSNPQKLAPNTEAGEMAHPQLVARVALAYDQALMSLWNFPDIWLEFAAWQESIDHEEAKAVLQRARDALPDCPLVPRRRRPRRGSATPRRRRRFTMPCSASTKISARLTRLPRIRTARKTSNTRIRPWTTRRCSYPSKGLRDA